MLGGGGRGETKRRPRQLNHVYRARVELGGSGGVGEGRRVGGAVD